jgi:hypothetical protein
MMMMMTEQHAEGMRQLHVKMCTRCTWHAMCSIMQTVSVQILYAFNTLLESGWQRFASVWYIANVGQLLHPKP